MKQTIDLVWAATISRQWIIGKKRWVVFIGSLKSLIMASHMGSHFSVLTSRVEGFSSKKGGWDQMRFLSLLQVDKWATSPGTRHWWWGVNPFLMVARYLFILPSTKFLLHLPGLSSPPFTSFAKKKKFRRIWESNCMAESVYMRDSISSYYFGLNGCLAREELELEREMAFGPSTSSMILVNTVQLSTREDARSCLMMNFVGEKWEVYNLPMVRFCGPSWIWNERGHGLDGSLHCYAAIEKKNQRVKTFINFIVF